MLGQPEFVLRTILIHLREDELLANRVLMMLESGSLRDPVSLQTQGSMDTGSYISLHKLRLVLREHIFQALDL